jgi:hydroxymethylpyrimidine/phosphomethylpyrimidine kinase
MTTSQARIPTPRPDGGFPQCLTIAGSDSGGGAGIQADLKTFHANGTFGMSVLTSITAQNTVRVIEAYDLPVGLVVTQLQAIFEDFTVAAAKTGMLSSGAIVDAVSTYWRSLSPAPPLVVDPVMISKGGFPLLDPEAVERLRRELLPLAAVVTPNRYEAELLSGITIDSRATLIEAGRRVLELGPGAVLLKGGHLDGEGFDGSRAVDYLVTEDGVREFSSERYRTENTHGTGCTYSAAICAWLARGLPLPDAIGQAKEYVAGAIRHGLSIGHGHGPTHHFWARP